MKITHAVVGLAGAAMVLGSAGVAVASGPLPGGTFDPPVVYSGGTGSFGAGDAIGDVNGDGFPDVVTTRQNELRVFPGAGGGALGTPTVYPLSVFNPSSVAVGDLNGDGRADVAVANVTKVDLFLQNTAGGLSSSGSLTVEARRLAIGDLTGDGRPDLAVIGWGADLLSVYPQQVGGTLGSPQTVVVPLSGYNDLELGDLDADGDLDVVVLSGQEYAVPDFTVVRQDPTGLVVVASYTVAGGASVNASGVGIGNIDGDPTAEVIVAFGGNRPDSKITVFQAGTDARLTEGVTRSTYDIPTPVEVADIDRDGYGDVVVGHNGWNAFSIFYGGAAGIGTTPELISLPGSNLSPHSIRVGDLDLDGDQDLAVLDNGSVGLQILRNRNVIAPPADAVVGLLAPSTVKRDVNFTTTLSVTSDGGQPVAATYTLTLGSNLTYVSNDGGCTFAGTTLTCVTPALAPGASKTVTVTVRGTKKATTSLTARITSTTPSGTDTSDDLITRSISIKP